MRSWVRPFLIEKVTHTFDEYEELKNHPDKEKIIALNQERFEDEQEVYQELATNFLNTNFGFGISSPRDTFMLVFGSVLADLPEEIFKGLCKMENLFFTFAPHPGAEVKTFPLGKSIRAGTTLRIVTFPYVDVFMPYDALRGEIAHELAHIHAEYNFSADEIEERADELVKSWGFEKEIKAFRDYGIEEVQEEIETYHAVGSEDDDEDGS